MPNKNASPTKKPGLDAAAVRKLRVRPKSPAKPKRRVKQKWRALPKPDGWPTNAPAPRPPPPKPPAGADEARLAAAKAGRCSRRSRRPESLLYYGVESAQQSDQCRCGQSQHGSHRNDLIGVEYSYAKEDGLGSLGVDVSSSENPNAGANFACPVSQIGNSSRNFVLVPVKFHPIGDAAERSTLSTDKLWVYLTDGSGLKSYIFQGTMVLTWKNPAVAAADAAALSQNNVQMEFKQNNAFAGYVTVKYFLGATAGKLRLRVYDSATPDSIKCFESEDVDVKSGAGFQLVKIAVSKDAASPDLFKADTLQLQLLDPKEKVLASQKQQLDMSWAKPK